MRNKINWLLKFLDKWNTEIILLTFLIMMLISLVTWEANVMRNINIWVVPHKFFGTYIEYDYRKNGGLELNVLIK